MTTLRVYLFGRFQAYREDRMLMSLEARKSQELFCYLLLYRDRTHLREALAALLWGDSTTAQSKKYLRQALWQLQAGINEVPLPDDVQPVLVDLEWLGINPRADLWLDVARFEDIYRCFEGVPGSTLTPENVNTLQEAVQLYQGGLLEGWYQDWCLYERERFQNMYLAMLDKLMAFCEAHGEFEAGINYGERILRCDHARERTYQQLMTFYYLLGDRTGALRQYERCAMALHEELGVKPARRTTVLYEQIRRDEFGKFPLPSLDAEQLNAAVLSSMLDYLEWLQALLADAQQRVQHFIVSTVSSK